MQCDTMLISILVFLKDENTGNLPKNMNPQHIWNFEVLKIKGYTRVVVGCGYFWSKFWVGIQPNSGIGLWKCTFQQNKDFLCSWDKWTFIMSSQQNPKLPLILSNCRFFILCDFISFSMLKCCTMKDLSWQQRFGIGRQKAKGLLFLSCTLQTVKCIIFSDVNLAVTCVTWILKHCHKLPT